MDFFYLPPHVLKMILSLITYVYACFLWVLCDPVTDQNLITDESKGIEFLEWYNAELSKVKYEYMLAQWEYNTNITKFNQDKAVSSSVD